MTVELRVAQVVSRTRVEGPGPRFAIWTQGCPLRCPGCCNLEMLPMEGGELVPVEQLVARILETRGIEGITLVGGEPFAQARACAELCEAAKEHHLSVMVFSGYTLEELAESSDEAWARLLATVDLLVDGRFERDRPERRRRWIGSTNQKVCFLSDRYAPDDPRFGEPNCIEIRLDGEGLQVNGWPELAAQLSKAGGDDR